MKKTTEADWSRRLRHEPPAAVDPAPEDEDALDSAVGYAAEHTRRYLATNGEDDGWDGPRPILIIYTIGRRSGAVRRNPLVYFDHEGRRYVVASKGGHPSHPAWYTNLLANPEVSVQAGARRYSARAETLSPADREALWPHLLVAHPMYADYQERTDRDIPVVELVDLEPAAAG